MIQPKCDTFLNWIQSFVSCLCAWHKKGEAKNFSKWKRFSCSERRSYTLSGSIAALTEVKWIKRLTCWTCWNKKPSDHYRGSSCKMATAAEATKTFRHGRLRMSNCSAATFCALHAQCGQSLFGGTKAVSQDVNFWSLSSVIWHHFLIKMIAARARSCFLLTLINWIIYQK